MLSTRLIHTAVAFFIVGVAMGMGMGATQDFRLLHVHAHINLLGWVALGLVGLIYAAHPRLAHGVLAHAHYWLHTLGLVLFMGAYAHGMLSGAKPVAAIATGASLVGLGVLLFGINVFTRLR
jgi:hypothetical protein